jgi:hypothetical protein
MSCAGTDSILCVFPRKDCDARCPSYCDLFVFEALLEYQCFKRTILCTAREVSEQMCQILYMPSCRGRFRSQSDVVVLACHKTSSKYQRLHMPLHRGHIYKSAQAASFAMAVQAQNGSQKHMIFLECAATNKSQYERHWQRKILSEKRITTF